MQLKIGKVKMSDTIKEANDLNKRFPRIKTVIFRIIESIVITTSTCTYIS